MTVVALIRRMFSATGQKSWSPEKVWNANSRNALSDSCSLIEIPRHPQRVIGLSARVRRSRFAAMVTRSAKESAFIFRIILPRCAFTVISLM